MKKGNGKRLAALLLSTAMLAAVMPAALADSETNPAAEPPENVFDLMDELADGVPEYVIPEEEYPIQTTEEVLAEEEAAAAAEETEEAAEATIGVSEETEEIAAQADEYIDSTYGYTLKGDPGYISDEAFFGKWSDASGKWTVSPKLDYDNYPGLSPVEAAVKKGDYEEAELAYYNYYVTKEAQLNRKKDVSTTVKDTITADLLQENFMYNGNSGFTPVAVMNFTDKDEYVSADITDIVQSKFTSTQELAFYITATNKDGGLAKIYSKDSTVENSAPYIQVKVNGTDLTIYPSADTYISAGNNRSKNYGSSSWLEAEESVSTIGTQSLVDSNTKRIYIRFNISGLKAGDTITAATLNLRGFNGVNVGTGDLNLELTTNEINEGKTEQDKLNETIAGSAPKKVVVIQNGDSAWNENSLNYSNATAQLIYSYDQDDTWGWDQPSGAGYRYQEELLRFSTWYDKLVKLYNATGDEAYAYTALRQIMDFITVSTAPGKQKPWLKTLDVAIRTQCMPGLTLQLINSEYMTPDIFVGFMKYMWDEGNDAKAFNTEGNWGSSETLGLYTVAANFPEFVDSTAWIARVKTRYNDICGKIMLADQTCTELSLGYTDYALSSTVDAKTLADSLGLTEYPFTDVTLNAIPGLAQYMMYASMPGFKDHQEGDGYSHRGSYKSRMLAIGKWYNDPHLLFAGSDGDEGYEPDFKSIMFPVGKKIAMRTGWDSNANYLYTSTDGGVGTHAHPDDLNIMVMAYGQYLLVDPLYGTYSTDSRRTWLISTKAHNVVNVNNTNQTTGSTRGSIDRWETNNSYDFVTESTPNDRNANYSRSILFVKPGFWLVNDYLTPKTSSTNSYVQNWHFLPEANISMDETTKTIRTGFEGVNIQVIPVAPERFDAASIDDGYYSEGQNSFSNAKYADYTINSNGTVIFNTILLPENVGIQYDVNVEEIEVDGLTREDASAYEFTMQEQSTGETTKYQYFQLHNTAKQGTYTVGSYTTDASMLFVEMSDDGKALSVIAQDVKNIKNDTTGVVLVNCDTALPEFSLKWSVGNVILDGATLTAEDAHDANLTVYSNGNNITNVSMNQTNMTAKQEGDYVYFGAEPSVTPGPSASATPSITPRPTSNSGSHGSGGGGGGGSSNGGTIVNPPTEQPTPTPTPTGTSDAQETPQPMTDTIKEEISGHWGEQEITALYDAGIVKGSGGSLDLGEDVTRSEFIAMVIRALGLQEVQYQDSFPDVTADDWYANILETAKEQGLIQGDSEGNANPNAQITREEMAVILNNAAEFAQLTSSDDVAAQFADDSAISAWAKEEVENATRLGLLSGYPNGTFVPQAYAKREEAFVVIYRLLKQIT